MRSPDFGSGAAFEDLSVVLSETAGLFGGGTLGAGFCAAAGASAAVCITWRASASFASTIFSVDASRFGGGPPAGCW